MDPFSILSYPFMQRAVAAGAVLALLLAVLGIFVTLRRMAFFGDGIAHASLGGIALAVVTGLSPLPIGLAWGVAVAALIYVLERRTRLPSDTLIGILFTASMAFGVAVMSFTKGYQPELVSFLFGNILSIRTLDLWIIGLLSAVILSWLALSFRSLVYMSFTEESARVSGVPVERKKLALYVSLALATVLGVKILGIILVSALLILPAATARLLAGDFRRYLVLTVIFAEIFVLSGLLLSFVHDLPPGASIILVGSAVFFLVALLRRG